VIRKSRSTTDPSLLNFNLQHHGLGFALISCSQYQCLLVLCICRSFTLGSTSSSDGIPQDLSKLQAHLPPAHRVDDGLSGFADFEGHSLFPQPNVRQLVMVTSSLWYFGCRRPLRYPRKKWSTIRHRWWQRRSCTFTASSRTWTLLNRLRRSDPSVRGQHFLHRFGEPLHRLVGRCWSAPSKMSCRSTSPTM
jgi:hypothetical protein